MTVNSTTSRVSYAGNGTTVTFTVAFYFLAASDLVVIKTSSAGVQTTLVLNTDYTVSGAGVPAGGSITCTTAPAAGETVVIFRDPAATQLTDYQSNDPFPAETHERALDKLTMLVQRSKDLITRSFTLSDGDTSGASTQLPIPTANNVIGWNSNATGLQNVTPQTLATIVSSGQTYADIFTGTGAQTNFTLSNNPGALYNMDVSVGGVTQLPNTDYTWVSGTTLTFTTAPPNGAKVLVRYSQALIDGTTDSASVNFQPSGSGAVVRTVQARLRERVSVLDYGAVANGTFTAGGSAGGTDNSAAFLAAFNAAIAQGSSRVHAPAGVYYFASKVTLPRGIILEGDGTAHLPVFLSGGIRRGTCLLIAGAAGNDCLAFEENAGHSGLRDISVYNTNTNAIRSVVSVIGQLYPRMHNVEIASLRKTTGAGLYLAPSSSGALYEALWGTFSNVIVTVEGVGLSYEASVRWGLSLYGTAVGKVVNANAFWGGQFAGTWGGLLCDGAVSGARPLSNVFHGTKFDTNWDGTYTPTFKSAAANVFGFTKANCYIYPVVRVNQGDGITFHGCYFEAAGSPATYNDGVNGSASLIPVMWLDNATNCVRTGAVDSNWNACYVFDAGSQSNIAPVTGGYRHNNQTAAALLLRQSTAQSIAAYAFTKIQFSNVLQGDDSNLEWDSTNYQVKIRQPGVYQISGQVSFAGWSTAGTYAVSRIATSAYNITGTYAPQIGAGNSITTTANICISLVTGDTIELQVLQNQGTNQALAVNESTLSVVKIG